jgi:hypothetical protein
MNKFKNLYLSNDQWKKLQEPGKLIKPAIKDTNVLNLKSTTSNGLEAYGVCKNNCRVNNKTISPIRKLFSGKRIKKALKAIMLSQKRLVDVPGFKEAVQSHNLNKKSYSRAAISRFLNRTDEVCDNDYIKWIKVFMHFFYTDQCIFISPEEHPMNEDSEDFLVLFKDYCRRWKDRKNDYKQKKQKTDTNRINGIVGRWKGEAVQEFKDGTKIPATLEGELDKDKDDNDRVKGKLRYSFEFCNEKITAAFKVSGEFLYDSFLRLDYINVDDFVMQFGAVVLELDSIGSNLKGKFVGYGAISNKIINADVYLKKVAAE